MTLIWLALCRSLTLDKCSPTTLLSTCRRYEITYFVYSENSQEILRICTHLFTRKFTRASLNLHLLLHLLLHLSLHSLIPSHTHLPWHATSSQSGHDQLDCLEALQIGECLYYLAMFQLKLRKSRSHET